MRERDWAAVLGCIFLAGCASSSRYAATKMDPSIPKYHTPECEAAREYAMGQDRGGNMRNAWENLKRACGEESIFPVMEEKAEKGDGRAQAWLAQAYANGTGVKKDPAQAAHWASVAAERGNVNAEASLGDFYASGFGVPQDDKLAAKWWAEAASHNLPEAETNLGRLYLEGKGVSQDAEKARQLFRDAATRGYGDAQSALASMYEKGQGVAQDDVVAYEWYKIAAGNGGTGAEDKWLAISKRLSRDQLRDAGWHIERCLGSRYSYCP